MFEHKGYVVGQTDQSIFIYKNDRLVLHASTNGKMDEEELMETVDFLIDKCIQGEMKSHSL
ncbi:MAG: hypothetical protein PHY47_15790 [Lachnospiraceae bacterium]|nr:hypothetical protein [Lachnospiraceae bacterium]